MIEADVAFTGFNWQCGHLVQINWETRESWVSAFSLPVTATSCFQRSKLPVGEESRRSSAQSALAWPHIGLEPSPLVQVSFAWPGEEDQLGLLCDCFWPRFFLTPASNLFHGLLVLLPNSLVHSVLFVWFDFLLTAPSQLFPDEAQQLFGGGTKYRGSCYFLPNPERCSRNHKQYQAKAFFPFGDELGFVL